MTEVNPSVEALRSEFGDKIGESSVSCGDTIVFVEGTSALDIMFWLKDTPDQEYNYLIDVTAVEHRDADKPLEVVYFLFSLRRKVQLCVKIALPKAGDLAVDSVVPVWKGADWLERETYDMFGIEFRGHPDLRRILMWETYSEGYPLRKDFPLKGHFSRSEQLRQALHAAPEAHYSLEELEIADALGDLPEDMKDRLARGERAMVPGSKESKSNG